MAAQCHPSAWIQGVLAPGMFTLLLFFFPHQLEGKHHASAEGGFLLCWGVQLNVSRPVFTSLPLIPYSENDNPLQEEQLYPVSVSPVSVALAVIMSVNILKVKGRDDYPSLYCNVLDLALTLSAVGRCENWIQVVLMI